VFGSTVRALIVPRRLVPILAIVTPMTAAQGSLSADPLAIPLAVVMSVCFVAVAPSSWRALFPRRAKLGAAAVLGRVAVYLGVGIAVVTAVGVVLPFVTGMGDTFLTSRPSVAIDLALFLVGGWGLGRDIDLEIDLAAERGRAEGLAREAERAQLLALRSHLEPHFLFNTLNAIAEWCRNDGEVAERAVLQLSAILRTVMEGVAAPAWPLARELELLANLFALHLLRDPDLFTLDRQLSPAASELLVPPMILLPLAENAMKHGPANGARGLVVLAVALDRDVLRVRIENPGEFTGPRAGGTGIRSVERRLALAYDGAATLSVRGEAGRTIAEVVMPRTGPRA